jgi:hypothetical protein
MKMCIFILNRKFNFQYEVISIVVYLWSLWSSFFSFEIKFQSKIIYFVPQSLNNITQQDMATFPTKIVRLLVKCNILHTQ